MPPDCYLESVFAVNVVIGLDWCDDVAGQRNAAEHRLLSAVCEKPTPHDTENSGRKTKQLPPNGAEAILRRLRVTAY